MAIRFGLYYFTEAVGHYLQQVINASPHGVITQAVLITDRLPIPEEGSADAWIIEYDDEAADMESWLEKIKSALDQPFLILYLQEADPEILLKALRLGIQECFLRQVTPEELARVCERLLKARRAASQGEQTRIVALLGAKGGVGVTFLAINLAQVFVEQKQPTLLLDLDLVPGGLGGSLDLKPRYTLHEVIENFHRLDPQYLQDIITTMASGLRVLPGPESMDELAGIQAFHIEKILHYLRVQQLFHWLIGDLGDALTEIALKALENADLILVVTCLTVPGLKAAKKLCETLEMLELNGERLQLVANGYHRKLAITPEEGQKYLGRNFLTVLRFEPEAVWRSLNEGVPLVAQQPDHRLAKEIRELARQLQPQADVSASSASFWARLLRFRR